MEDLNKMEQLLKYKDLNKIEIIIRPGMVYNKQKSYITELIKKIIKFKFFPYFSLKKNIQPIHIDDFNECIFRIISMEKNFKLKEYNLATEHQISIKDFIKFICKDNKIKNPFFIFLPFTIVIFFSKIIDQLKLTKFSLVERIYGLFYLPKINTEYHLQNLNYKLKNDFL